MPPFGSVPEFSAEAVVIVDPFGDVVDGEIPVCLAHDYAADPGIYHHALAHHTGACSGDYASGYRIGADYIKVRAEHMFPCCGDDRVCLGVNGTAELVSFAAGDVETVAEAFSEIAAVHSAAGSTVVAGGDYGVVFDNYRPIAFSQAGAPFGYGLCYVEIVVCL